MKWRSDRESSQFDSHKEINKTGIEFWKGKHKP